MNARINTNKPSLVFDRILQNERGYARLNYLNMRLVELDNPSITNQVLYEWLDLIGRSEYFSVAQLRAYIGASVLRQRFTKIDSSVLTPQQKQTIKDYYLRVLPFLQNPPDQDELAQAQRLAQIEAEEPEGNENNENNASTISILSGNRGTENNAASVATRGGKRKSRRSKKTRKHKTRKH